MRKTDESRVQRYVVLAGNDHVPVLRPGVVGIGSSFPDAAKSRMDPEALQRVRQFRSQPSARGRRDYFPATADGSVAIEIGPEQNAQRSVRQSRPEIREPLSSCRATA